MEVTRCKIELNKAFRVLPEGTEIVLPPGEWVIDRQIDMKRNQKLTGHLSGTSMLVPVFEQ